jgi:hypothetical protein
MAKLSSPNSGGLIWGKRKNLPQFGLCVFREPGFCYFPGLSWGSVYIPFNYMGYVNELDQKVPLALPLLYRDSVYGNVYCSDLMVDYDVDNATMTLDGNLITSDDIEMNGKKSDIRVNGNFVGLNSEASPTGDGPNASSAIINNMPFELSGRTAHQSSTIT